MSSLIHGVVTFPNAVCPQKAKIFLSQPGGCSYVTYTSFLNQSSLVGGGAGTGASLTVDPAWTAEPAALTAEILASSGDYFQFQIRSGQQRGLTIGLRSGLTASNNYPDLWYGFSFDFSGSDIWWIEDIGGGVALDPGVSYSTDDVFKILYNSSNKAEFYRNAGLVFTSPEDIPIDSKLNVYLQEENGGVREVQFCTSGGAAETFTGITVEPASGSNQGSFDYLVPGLGSYTFRAQLESEIGVIGGSTIVSIEVV